MVIAMGPEIALRSRSASARGRYTEITEQATRQPGIVDRLNAVAVLERNVAWLELFYIGALGWEFIHEHGIHSVEQLRTRASELDHFVRSAFPDLSVGQHQVGALMEELQAHTDQIWSDWSRVKWSQVVRSFDAVTAQCPIEALEELGTDLDEPSLAHRARNAYDALRAFVRRHDPAHAETMRIVGKQYRLGNLRLKEVANLLGMPTSDAVFELEQNGFSRPPAAIGLDDEERAAIYKRLRDYRFQRGGVPVVDPDLVERDVIASERIESVDARRWIRR